MTDFAICYPAGTMKNKKLSILGVIVGSFLTLGPVWAVLGSMLGMAHALNTLGPNGIGDPQKLADSIGATIWLTTTGFLFVPIGLILLIPSIIFLCQQRNSHFMTHSNQS